MRRRMPALLPGALALFGILQATPAAAQYREEQAGRVGSGTVLRIFENNRFHRCAASFNNPQMLRIAFTASRRYAMSVPAVNAPPGRPLLISVTSTGAPSFSMSAQTNGQRTSTDLDMPTVEAMMRFRGPLIVEAGARRFQWSLGASVENVMIAIENCTNRAQGGR